MPVPPIAHASQAVGGPRHDVRHVAGQLLLAPGAHVAPARVGGRHSADEPVPVRVPFATLDPTEESGQVDRAFVAAASVGPGHAPIMPTA